MPAELRCLIFSEDSKSAILPNNLSRQELFADGIEHVHFC